MMHSGQPADGGRDDNNDEVVSKLSSMRKQLEKKQEEHDVWGGLEE